MILDCALKVDKQLSYKLFFIPSYYLVFHSTNTKLTW